MDKVAIVGVSFSIPGAETLLDLQDIIFDGRIAVQETYDFDDSLSYVKKRGIPRNYDNFDNKLFNYDEFSAVSTDPQHRLLIEHAFCALEGVKIDPEDVGVFTSTSNNGYKSLSGNEPSKNIAQSIKDQIAQDKDHVSSKIAYILGLGGPALNIQSACSSSLVNLHNAINSLMVGDCGTAVVGSSSLQHPIEGGYKYYEGGVNSKSGRCCPFNHSSTGTVPASGTIVVILKKLEQAKNDGDQILSIVSGSAVVNDGFDRAGFTAPSESGQERVYRKAISRAGISISDVRYIECHGTGTKIGDVIEYNSLQNFYGQTNSPVYLGSIKANVGHMDTTAGLCGLLKASIVSNLSIIPALTGFELLNADIVKSSKNVLIPKKNSKLFKETIVSAVSSFGMGGTNCHVILDGFRSPKLDCYKESFKVRYKYRQHTLISLLIERLNRIAKEHDGLPINILRKLKHASPIMGSVKECWIVYEPENIGLNKAFSYLGITERSQIDDSQEIDTELVLTSISSYGKKILSNIDFKIAITERELLVYDNNDCTAIQYKANVDHLIDDPTLGLLELFISAKSIEEIDIPPERLIDTRQLYPIERKKFWFDEPDFESNSYLLKLESGEEPIFVRNHNLNRVRDYLQKALTKFKKLDIYFPEKIDIKNVSCGTKFLAIFETLLKTLNSSEDVCIRTFGGIDWIGLSGIIKNYQFEINKANIEFSKHLESSLHIPFIDGRRSYQDTTKYTFVLIGGAGQVGTKLTNHLLANKFTSKVFILSRGDVNIVHHKNLVHIQVECDLKCELRGAFDKILELESLSINSIIVLNMCSHTHRETLNKFGENRPLDYFKHVQSKQQVSLNLLDLPKYKKLRLIIHFSSSSVKHGAFLLTPYIAANTGMENIVLFSKKSEHSHQILRCGGLESEHDVYDLPNLDLDGNQISISELHNAIMYLIDKDSHKPEIIEFEKTKKYESTIKNEVEMERLFNTSVKRFSNLIRQESGLNNVKLEKSFMDNGIDSLDAISIISEARCQLKIELEMSELLSNRPIITILNEKLC